MDIAIVIRTEGIHVTFVPETRSRDKPKAVFKSYPNTTEGFERMQEEVQRTLSQVRKEMPFHHSFVPPDATVIPLPTPIPRAFHIIGEEKR